MRTRSVLSVPVSDLPQWVRDGVYDHVRYDHGVDGPMLDGLSVDELRVVHNLCHAVTTN